jgi:hypothetical protein
MDRMQFAGHLALVPVDGVTPTVCGGEDRPGSFPRVWLGNGWGLRITRVYPNGNARVEAVRFTEPFDANWTEEPSWKTDVPGRNLPEWCTDPAAGVWDGVGLDRAARLLGCLAGLGRVQPHTD